MSSIYVKLVLQILVFVFDLVENESRRYFQLNVHHLYNLLIQLEEREREKFTKECKEMIDLALSMQLIQHQNQLDNLIYPYEYLL